MKRNDISKEQIVELYATLKKRVEKNSNGKLQYKWEDIQEKLEKYPSKIESLFKMEETGGEPNIIGYDSNSKMYIFCDCSPESPKGRRSLCYDDAALKSRKENKPNGSALAMAKEMGIELLNEKQYLELQELGEFDMKTSSWLLTDSETRNSGGAIFGDSRYGRTFIYHNGAESYYAARGFRGILRV
jgi:hypothetical protein